MWDKRDVLRLCGYTDRLQSSRRIPLDRSDGVGVVLARCNAALAAASERK